MEVIHATKAMLNECSVEEKDEGNKPAYDNYYNSSPITILYTRLAGPLTNVDAEYKPVVATDEASLGEFLRNEQSVHSIFKEATSTNIHYSRQKHWDYFLQQQSPGI